MTEKGNKKFVLFHLARKICWLLFLGVGVQKSLSAQVFEITGGTSTLYQATGGDITVHAASYDMTIGAGVVDGHVLGGARLVKATPRATYILGDERIGFRLPTDVFDISHFFLSRGLGVRTKWRGNDVHAFVGATATDYNSPLFNGAKTNNPAGVLFLKRDLGPHLQFFSDTVFTNRTTAIEAIQWSPVKGLDMALAGGLGANQPYAASSLNFVRPWIGTQAAYIRAGAKFHRVALTSPFLAEPDRENVLATIRPFRSLALTGAHQNFLVPQYPTTNSVRSSVDQGSAGWRIFGASLNGALYHSSYENNSNHAVSLSATRDFTERLHVMTNYLASRPKGSAPTNSFIASFFETVSPRLSVSESLTTSGGHTSITFGGQLISNFISAGANYETYYVPADNSNPFQQALVANITMNLLKHITLHGESFVDPTGTLRYTAEVRTVMWRGQTSGPLLENVRMEPAVMRGCVLDTTGQPIEGAAVLIDNKMVYTDSAGCFFVREHRTHTHTLRVALTDFLSAGSWRVVSAPATITSAPDKERAAETPIVVVLTRVWVESVPHADPGGVVPPQ